VWEACLPVRYAPHPNRMLRSSGEERSPSGRAQRGDMKVGECDAVACQRVDVRCIDI